MFWQHAAVLTTKGRIAAVHLPHNLGLRRMFPILHSESGEAPKIVPFLIHGSLGWTNSSPYTPNGYSVGSSTFVGPRMFLLLLDRAPCGRDIVKRPCSDFFIYDTLKLTNLHYITFTTDTRRRPWKVGNNRPHLMLCISEQYNSTCSNCTHMQSVSWKHAQIAYLLHYC